jgi:hypothetical protein
LIQRCARLAKELQARTGVELASGTYELAGASTSLERLFTDVATVTQCAERVLGVMAQHAHEAYLYLPDADGVKLAASQKPGATPPAEVARWVAERMQAAAESGDNTVLIEEAVDATVNTRVVDDRSYTLNLLYAADAHRDVVVGITVIAPSQKSMQLQPDTIAALSGYLFKALQAG